MSESNVCQNSTVKPKKNRVYRALLIVAGTASLVFAAIGMVLPLIPYTPFLLLTVACYCRSSERLYNWLINNKIFGEYIRNYREGKGIPLKTKAFALTVLWTTISISTLVFMPTFNMPVPIWSLQVLLLTIATAVSIHILRLPTYRKRDLENANNASQV